MIRFVDLTEAYWTDLVPEGRPLAGFISTSDDNFVKSLDGQHTFHGFDEIDEHPMGQRLRALVPEGFFDQKPEPPSHIPNVETCYCQTIRRGDQVAYVKPVKIETKGAAGRTIEITGGRLCVSRVLAVVKVSDGWAEMDPTVNLVLENGDTVDCTDCAKTDGNFRYADQQLENLSC